MTNLDRYLLALLVVGYTGKLLAFGATLPDALVIMVLAGAHFLFHWQVKNKEITELKQELTSVKKDLDSIKNETDQLRNNVANAVVGIKMSNGFKTVK